MSTPTDDAYRRAAHVCLVIAATDGWPPPRTSEDAALRTAALTDRQIRAAVDAVWPLAVAEGRRLAAEAIRAKNARLEAAWPNGSAATAYDDAARIAASDQT